MFFWIGVILLVGFVMYRVGKSTGSSSTREEIKKQRLRRKIAERKAAESGTQMAGQTVMPAAGERMRRDERRILFLMDIRAAIVMR